MNKIYLYSCSILILGVLFAPAVFAQDNEDMEVIQVSDGYRILVPKGAKTEQKNGQIVVEDTNAFVLRKLNEIEKTLNQKAPSSDDVAVKMKELKDDILRQVDEIQDNMMALSGAVAELKDELEELRMIVGDVQYTGDDLAEMFLKASDADRPLKAADKLK